MRNTPAKQLYRVGSLVRPRLFKDPWEIKLITGVTNIGLTIILLLLRLI